MPSHWGTADAEISDPIVENPEFKGSPRIAWSKSDISLYASPTARYFFLANFYLPRPFTFIFFQKLAQVFSVLAVANASSCVGPQSKIGHLAPSSQTTDAGTCIECQRNIKRLQTVIVHRNSFVVVVVVVSPDIHLRGL